MKRIVQPNKDDVTLDSIKDNNIVGIKLGSEKYVVVSKRVSSTEVVYCRMNDRFCVLNEDYKSIKTIVEYFTMAECFVFVSQSELYNWLLK